MSQSKRILPFYQQICVSFFLSTLITAKIEVYDFTYWFVLVSDMDWPSDDLIKVAIPYSTDKDFSNAVYAYFEKITSDCWERIDFGSHLSKEALNVHLTAVDYYMDFIRFTLRNTNNDITTNLKLFRDVQRRITLFEKLFLEFGSLSEEQKARSRRIEGCFRDIFFAVEDWGQLRREGPISAQPVSCWCWLNRPTLRWTCYTF